MALRERKTGHTRVLPITSEIRKAVTKIDGPGRSLAGGSALAYLFRARRWIAGRRHKRHRTTIYRHFEAAVKKAGLEGLGYTVHSLRKVYARNLYNKTGSILAVQKDLGHKNISTTILYCMGDDLHM